MKQRGFTIVELLAIVVVVVLMLGFTLPAVQSARCDAGKAGSIANLMTIAGAHAMYAADWNDRQFTLVPDDLGAAGGNCANYLAGFGCIPGAVLGDNCHGQTIGFYFGCDGDPGGCNNLPVIKPINWFGSFRYSGAFRLPNARGFHEYLNGRFYDPVMWAPKDRIVLNVVEELFEKNCEYVNSDITQEFSASYILSPAAMYHPDVFAPQSEGGWNNPDSMPNGYESPTVSQATFAHQKSRMLEHHWLEHPPADPCNPGFDPGSYNGCEPYYFNHSLRSNPMTLFYDGHVTGLSTLEAMISNDRVETQTGNVDRLWNRDTPWGANGYLIEYGFDSANTSYHILTTRGIMGRDTTQ